VALVDRSLERRLEPFFAWIVTRRWLIIAIYSFVVVGAGFLAVDIPRDNSLENLVVSSDPDVAASHEFEKIFPEAATVFLMLETDEPLSAGPLSDLERLESELGAIDGVNAFSITTVWRRSRPGSGSPTDDIATFSEIVEGSDFFRRQGLIGDNFLAIVLALDAPEPEIRDALLGSINEIVFAVPEWSRSIDRVRRVGRPWIDAWLERETTASSLKFFPLFAAFVISLVLGLYRSWRALVVILVSLGVAVLLGMAFAGLAGLGFTIVSSLVPLTLLVTATASLVYLHSRFVDQPADMDLETHRIRALANKAVAVSASVFAAAVGFAALTVSNIRPIRELGIWTSGGLLLGWIVCFTLYPALQTVLRAPTRRHRQVAGTWVIRAADVIPRWSYRWRWPLVITALALAVSGLIALLGIPGVLPGMELETNPLAYIDADEPVAKDTRYFQENVLGIVVAKIWITTPEYGVLDPEVIRGLDSLTRELEVEPAVGSVVGLPSILRLRRYLAGLGEDIPADEPALDRLMADLEQLMLTEPSISQWVDLDSLSSTYLTVTSAAGSEFGLGNIATAIERAWGRAAGAQPALADCSYRLAGTGVLQATIASHLTPTLVESFAITFTIIFVTFIFVFRSGPARLNAGAVRALMKRRMTPEAKMELRIT
jgi:predicted RND superfamily exporter protein